MAFCSERIEITVGKIESGDQSNNKTIVIDLPEKCDITVVFPENIGSGNIRQLYFNNGIRATIIDSVFYDTVSINEIFWESDVRLSIIVSGACTSIGDDAILEPGTCLITYNSTLTERRIINPLDHNLHIMISPPPDFLYKIIHEKEIRKLLNINNVKQKKEISLYQFKTCLSPMTSLLIDQINSLLRQGVDGKDLIKEKIVQIAMCQTAMLTDNPKFTLVPGVLRGDDIKKILLARDILVRNLVDPPSLVDLATEAGINEYKLKKGFKEVFGSTVYEYLRAQRMQHARELLIMGNMKVIEISYLSGYSNPSNFALHFKKTFGVNPGKFLSSVRENFNAENTNKCI